MTTQKSNKARIRNAHIVIFTLLIILAVITLFPILYTFFSSFKTNIEILAKPERLFPENWSMENYITAWKSPEFPVPRLFVNSVVYSVATVMITLFLSATGGYVFARGDFPLKNVIFMVFSSLMFISLGTITIYALFKILRAVHLTSSLWTLIVLKLFGIQIVNYYLVRSYIKTLPMALDEAARIDGCSFIGIFFRIILPLLKPILATVGILSFNSSWNDYLMPTIFTLTDPSQRTLIVGLMTLKSTGESAAAWNLMLAGTVISLIPVLVAYAIGNKYFISGIAAGAVKG